MLHDKNQQCVGGETKSLKQVQYTGEVTEGKKK